jgi:hypothetical protein
MASKRDRECNATEEYDRLWETLSRQKPSTRECESTVPGEPSFVVESHLPSIFDYYPALKRRVVERARTSKEEAVALMHDCMRFIETGDKSHLREPAEMGFGGVVDLTADEDEPASDAEGTWQVSLGDEGWADLDNATNKLCEAALKERRREFTFTGFQGMQYLINVEKLIQKNCVSGTVRPLRRTTGALFG